MGKIGDLFVRLGLKSDEFKKGIKEAKKETEGFGNKLREIKLGAIAVWAAIGTGVMKLARDVIGATNAMSDAFEQMTSSWKASYTNALAEISAKSKKGGWLRFFNLSDPKAAQQLGANAKAAGDAAKEMTQAFDAEFELVNSVALQRQGVQKELNELLIAMRDTTLSPEARMAAAERYKALLEPIAKAEVAVYGKMLQAAVTQWQAGVDLDREYSVDELTEFFSKIGTEYDKMAAKFPDLMRVYETRKGDASNQPIFNIISAWQKADALMSEVEKTLSRTTNAIKAEQQRNIQDLKTWANNAAASAQDIIGVYDELGDGFDEWLDRQADLDLAKFDDFVANSELTKEWEDNLQRRADAYTRMAEQVAAMNDMLEHSIEESLSNGIAALTEFALGVEGVGWEQALAAFIQPLADTMRQMGEMFIAEGLAVVAFKKSIKNPYAAIATGAALIAVSAAVSSGLQMLTANPAGSTAASSGAGSSTSNIETYEQDITIHVVGEISGDKIILAGQKTLNKWSR